MEAWNLYPIFIKENNQIKAAIPKHSMWQLVDDIAILMCDKNIIQPIKGIQFTFNPPESTRRFDV
jgi:hypothetical protein